MRCILSTEKNIYFHLASEEYLLKHSDEEICILWESDESVVIGKHQNAMAEVNYLWALEKKINVARRLSGGGTVYHGPGNLNFTFIRTGEKGKLVDFKRFVKPVVEYLNTLNIPAAVGTRNDILVKELKISGNAEHVYKDRVLHHGTLLFNANLDTLNTSIKVEENKYFGRAVESVRSKVANISDFLNKPLSQQAFTAALFDYLLSYFPDSVKSELLPEEMEAIKLLIKEKYERWEWIYGYSPNFEVKKTTSWRDRDLRIRLLVKKGLIVEVEIDLAADKVLAIELEGLLTESAYRLEETSRLLHKLPLKSEDADLLARCFY